MASLLQFFQRLFASDFMPHGHCFFWQPGIPRPHVISDSAIALASFSIPMMLSHFVKQREGLGKIEARKEAEQKFRTLMETERAASETRLRSYFEAAAPFAKPWVRTMGTGMDSAGRRMEGSEFPVESGLLCVQGAEAGLTLGWSAT